MATFEQCQREYDNQSPEEKPVCPLCGEEIVENGCIFECTSCSWYDYPDYFDCGGSNE